MNVQTVTILRVNVKSNPNDRIKLINISNIILQHHTFSMQQTKTIISRNHPQSQPTISALIVPICILYINLGTFCNLHSLNRVHSYNDQAIAQTIYLHALHPIHDIS